MRFTPTLLVLNGGVRIQEAKEGRRLLDLKRASVSKKQGNELFPRLSLELSVGTQAYSQFDFYPKTKQNCNIINLD